jgi:hypothetical protein
MTRAAAHPQPFPRLESDSAALEFARLAEADSCTWTDLAMISLWASSAADANRGTSDAHRMEQLQNAVTELHSLAGFPAAPKARAEFILTFMHDKFLKAYTHNQTRLDTLLDSGRYNCVSSAVLYLLLAKASGIEAAGVMTKDHAFITLHIDGESIDVETTNPWGFDPGNRKDFHDEFGKLTGFAYVPARSYRDRSTINQLELISLILSNRIAELESRKRYAEAVPLAIDRAALLSRTRGAREAADAAPSFFETPRQDVMNRIFNYGAFLLQAGNEEACLRWAALAAPRYPDDSRWQEFIHAAVNNRMRKLIQAKQFDAAASLLAAQEASLAPAAFTQLDTLLADAEIVNRASKIRTVEDGDRVSAAIVDALRRGRLNAARAGELAAHTVQKTAAALAAPPAKDWLAAIRYIESAAAGFDETAGLFGPQAESRLSGELEKALRVYRNNRAADFHNRFAAAWNKRNYDEARRILDEGIAEFPENAQLRADKKAIE